MRSDYSARHSRCHRASFAVSGTDVDAIRCLLEQLALRNVFFPGGRQEGLFERPLTRSVVYL